jgi:hypothetical protein
MGKIRILGLAGCVALTMPWLLGAASAQPVPTRKITPVPFNDAATATVSVNLDPGDLRIGATTPICFQSSRAGYATLWNVSTEGSVGLVYPNAYQRGTDGGQATRIEGSRIVCAGSSGDAFRFRIDGPAGTEDLYLLWTAQPGIQPPAERYDNADLFAEALKRVATARPQDWAVAKVTYDIVPSTGPVVPNIPVAPAPPPPTASAPLPAPSARRVFVLAMGANVDKLTKPNQDATLFTQVIAARFPVADRDIRLVQNATNADFQAGMDWLRGTARADDLVFVYFSGHGARPKDPTGTSADGFDQVLIPYDFQTKQPGYIRKAIWSQDLAGMINRLPTDNVIAVIDTCFSGGVYRSIEGGELGARNRFWKIPDDILLVHDAPAGQPATRAVGGAGRIQAKGLLFAAASPDQSALENSQGGVFTMALLRQVANSTGGTFADAFWRASEQTRTATQNRQTPATVGDMHLAQSISFVP